MSQALAHSTPTLPVPGLHARGAQTYFQTHVQSRSPIELVVLMYDAGLRFLAQARTAMTDNDLVAKRHALSRGMAIVSELQSMLNMEAGGEFAERLDALYTYINGRCLAANSERNPAGLDEAIRLLGTLRSGWAELAAASSSAA
jgi:flagellar secretion chaperone FliS